MSNGPDPATGSGDLPSRPGKDPEFRNVLFQLTRPERWIALAAGLVIVVNLVIGHLILSKYSLSNSTWLISLMVLAAMYFFYAGERAPWHSFYPWMVEMGAWALGAIGLVRLIGSISDSSPTSGTRLVFQVVLYVAAGFSVVGAFQLRRGD